MQKNSITNKITPCCGLPFSVIYWWVSNLTLNSESDRQFILSKISQGGTISIDGWKVLINSGTLEADASLTKSEFLAWFDCGRQPSCEQLKLIIEGFKISNYTPEGGIDYITNNIYQFDPEQIVPSEALYNDTPETLAGDILKRVDKTTGENVNYRETTMWHDGSAMTDAKVDGVIYIKRNGKFYKRQFENEVVNIKWFGAIGDGTVDDTLAIQKAHDIAYMLRCVLFFPKGHYVATSTLKFKTGLSIKFHEAAIIKKHSGDGIIVINSIVWYDECSWDNIYIITDALYKFTGVGVKILKTARFKINGLRVVEAQKGLVLEDVMVSTFNDINIDRCSDVSLELLKDTNGNAFNEFRALGWDNTIGVKIDSLNAVGLFSNSFNSGHIEYCNTAIETNNSTHSLIFNNIYFENNREGAVLRKGSKNIYFNNCYIANETLISERQFGAKGVFVNGISDEHPIGVGNNQISIVTTESIIDYRNNIKVWNDDYLSSKNFGAHSIFHSHGGNPASQFASNCMNRIWTLDHQYWVGGITEVGKIGKAPYYNITDARWISFPESGVANQNYTFQLLVKGKGVIRLKASDNVSKITYKDFNINTIFFQPISLTINFGETTSENIALFIDILSQDQNEKIAVSCADFHKGLLLNPFVHRQYNQTENPNFEVINMLNFRLKAGAVPSTSNGYINGDEIVNDFSVDDTFFKAVLVNGSWKYVKFS